MAASAKVQRLLIVILVGLLTAIAVLELTRGSTSSAPAKPIAKSPFDGPTMAPGCGRRTSRSPIKMATASHSPNTAGRSSC